MRTVFLPLLLLLALTSCSLAVHCSRDEHCGAPQIRGKCVAGRCVFTPRHQDFWSSFKPPRKACSTGADCDDASTCVDGKCRVNNGSGGACSADAFCPDNYQCVDSECEPVRKMFVAVTPPVRCLPPRCHWD